MVLESCLNDVGQKFHLVSETLLLPRGLILTSGLLTNGLIQEQSYRQIKSFTEELLTSQDEKGFIVGTKQ